MVPVTSLCIVYDAACGLCTSVQDWVSQQTPLVDLEFVAAGSAEARQRFPLLPAGELAVISGTGEIWLGNSAWIVCLWGLADYRNWAIRLSSPPLLLMAREAFAIVSRHRARFSELLRVRSDLELEQQLRKVMISRCEPGQS